MKTKKINKIIEYIRLAQYKKIHRMVPIACVDIVLTDGEKILLHKRANKPAQGQWWFPGGRIMKGEKLKKAALRKCEEEFGLKSAIKGIIGADETIFKDGSFRDPTHTINILMLGLIGKNAVPKLDNQGNEWKWFRTPEKKFHPYVKKYFEIALSSIRKTK